MAVCSAETIHNNRNCNTVKGKKIGTFRIINLNTPKLLKNISLNTKMYVMDNYVVVIYYQQLPLAASFTRLKYLIFFSQLHVVFYILQGRPRKRSIKTLHAPLSTEFWWHCVFSGGTQRRTLTQHPSEEMKIIHFLQSTPQPMASSTTAGLT